MKRMQKIVTIHQPDFFPWIGFFRRWKQSDLFIVLDDVQFIRRGWHHRDQIKTAKGVRWLTVPVEKKGNYLQAIRDVRISECSEWRRNHLNAIAAAYKDAPFFKAIFPKIEQLYAKPFSKIMDFNISILQFVAELFTIDTPVKYASDFKITAKGTDRILQLIKRSGGTDYLTGLGAKGYLNESQFTSQQIRVLWDGFIPPRYPQLHGEFVPTLSIIDALMMNSNEAVESMLYERGPQK